MTMEEDRISSLPDDILSIILSSLELRDAIRTSVLSKRWKKVWTSIHRVYLDNESCLEESSPHLWSKEEKNKRRTNFIKFVNHVLCDYDDTIQLSVTSFSLRYSFDWFGDKNDEEVLLHLVEWIAAAVTPKLERFEFRMDDCAHPPPIEMPRALFQCQKLVILKLVTLYLDVPETVSLPSLKKLHLDRVQFNDENSLKNILSGCPVLEQLCLFDIQRYAYGRTGVAPIVRVEQQNVLVLSPSLKILRVINSGHCYGFGKFYVVDAPRLECFDFEEHSLTGFTMKASPLVVSARIDIDICKYCSDFRSPLSLMDLFRIISNVRTLEFSTHKIIMLKEELAVLPEFHNLIRLEIALCENRDIIPCILQHSTYLKHLIFDEVQFRSEAFVWSPPELIPKCLTLHLETIEIIRSSRIFRPVWRKEGDSLKMIEYILGKGKVLKKMNVRTSFLDEEARDKLKGYSRASAKCRVVYSSEYIKCPY